MRNESIKTCACSSCGAQTKLAHTVDELFQNYPNLNEALWELFYYALSSTEADHLNNLDRSNMAFLYKSILDLTEQLKLQ